MKRLPKYTVYSVSADGDLVALTDPETGADLYRVGPTDSRVMDAVIALAEEAAEADPDGRYVVAAPGGEVVYEVPRRAKEAA